MTTMSDITGDARFQIDISKLGLILRWELIYL